MILIISVVPSFFVHVNMKMQVFFQTSFLKKIPTLDQYLDMLVSCKVYHFRNYLNIAVLATEKFI